MTNISRLLARTGPVAAVALALVIATPALAGPRGRRGNPRPVPVAVPVRAPVCATTVHVDLDLGRGLVLHIGGRRPGPIAHPCAPPRPIVRHVPRGHGRQAFRVGRPAIRHGSPRIRTVGPGIRPVRHGFNGGRPGHRADAPARRGR